MTDNNLRKIEVFKNEAWERTSMQELSKDDVFRMFEPNGDRITNTKGNYQFMAISTPKETDGVWGCEAVAIANLLMKVQ